jgi:hypothetical protein
MDRGDDPALAVIPALAIAKDGNIAGEWRADLVLARVPARGSRFQLCGSAGTIAPCDGSVICASIIAPG